MDKSKPVSVLDVAAYILEKQPKKHPITAWKLQKLIYYSQAWSLVWDELPLFKEKILAWANGPVVKELYQLHKGLFLVKELSKGNSNNLSKGQKDTIDHVLKAYGDKSAQWLSDLTHREMPWIEARHDLKPGERGEVEIQLSTMDEYYSSVDALGQPIEGSG
ncbi:MAG: type II toxin-antitoxin system antitoxin SocA domain-containing protein [Chlamydiota bacterium]